MRDDSPPVSSELARSPLDAAHRRLGARMAEFGGWEMPISYAGVIEEHNACRADAVVFDVSHLGTLRVTGPGAKAVVQATFTNDLDRIEVGRAQYTHLLDPEDAHVVDDVILWWTAPDEITVMPNASNTAQLESALEAGLDADTDVANVTSERVVLAVQGPQARERLATVAAELADADRFTVRAVTWNGAACVVAGTGYTGEDGVEIQAPLDAAEPMWQALLDAGVAPAGLGARDTLRLEAGLPLHGHELGPGITPLQAGLGWVVAWEKGPFRGREALLTEREAGVKRRLVGLVCAGRRPPREGCAVMADGRRVGEVTSGNFSPVLGRGIAMALCEPDLAQGRPVVIDVRGRPLDAVVGPTRFLDAR